MTEPGEEVVEARNLDPRVRILWWISGLLWAVAATAGSVLANRLLVSQLLPLGWSASWIPPAVAAVALGLALILPPVRYRRWRYRLRAHDLWIRHGIVWITVSVIPYARLQFVDTEQGPLDRVFGLASLVVHTAAPGTSGRIPGLDAGEAEELRERIAHLEGTLRDDPT